MIKEQQELPEGWEHVKLGDVVSKIIGGGTPSKNNLNFWSGNIPWLTVKDMRTRRPAVSKDHISEIAVAQSSTNIIPANTVIIATRIGLGKVIRVPYEAAINQDLKALILPPEMEKGYLEYWFVSKSNYLESIGSGTTVKGIRLEQLKNLDFPLAPQIVQKQIVAKIEELFSHIDAGIEGLKKSKALLKQYRQSILKSAIAGELTKEWREQNANNIEPASQLLERILKERRQRWEQQQIEKFQAKDNMPTNDKWQEKYLEPKSVSAEIDIGSWQMVSLEQIADVGTGATPKRGNPTYYENGTIPWVTSGALNAEFITEASELITELAIKETNVSVFPKHTLLVAMYGEGKTRGKVSELLIESGTNQACAGLVFKGLAEQCRDYVKLFFYMNYDDIRRLSSGGVQPNLNLSIIKATKISLPSREEQKEIVQRVEEKLTATDRLMAELDTKLTQAQQQKQTILASAFKGELV